MSLHPCEACGAPAPAGRHADPAECIATLTRERNEAVEYAVNRVAACWKLEKQRDEALAHVETLREALRVERNEALTRQGATSEMVCDECNALMNTPDGLEPTPECNICAQAILSDARSALASTPAQSLAAVEARVAERCAEIVEGEIAMDDSVGLPMSETQWLDLTNAAAAIRSEFGIGGTK